MWRKVLLDRRILRNQHKLQLAQRRAQSSLCGAARPAERSRGPVLAQAVPCNAANIQQLNTRHTGERRSQTSVPAAARTGPSDLRCSRLFATHPKRFKIVMPAFTPDMKTGKIVQWTKKVGDEISPGDTVAVVDTEMAVIELHSEQAGYLADIRVQCDTEVPVGTTLAEFTIDKDFPDTPEEKAAQTGAAAANSGTAPPAESNSSAANSGSDAKIAPEDASQKLTSTSHQAQTAELRHASGTSAAAARGAWSRSYHVLAHAAPRVEVSSSRTLEADYFSPAVARLLNLHSIDPASVAGSGRKGRLLKEDLLKAIKSQSFRPRAAGKSKASVGSAKSASTGASKLTTSPAASQGIARSIPRVYEDISNDDAAVSVAKRKVAAKTDIPHTYTYLECRVDELLTTKQQLQAELGEKGGAPSSVTPFFVRAAIVALQTVPEAATRWDVRQQAPVAAGSVDVSVLSMAKKVPSVALVKGGDRKLLADIVRDVEGTSVSSDTSQASFSVQDLGSGGIGSSTAVITSPLTWVLSVGAPERRLLLTPVSLDGDVDDASTAATNPGTGTYVQLTLTSDQRCVDSAVAAKFLKAFRSVIENPYNLFA